MKSIIVGIIFSILLYIIVAMYNHTWDIMKFSEASTHTLGMLLFLLWIVIYLTNLLGLTN